MGWLHDLSTGWLAVVVFAASYLVAAAIFVVVMALAKGRRAEAFKAVSPGLLPPMGLLFGLLVGFLAAQVWSNPIGLSSRWTARRVHCGRSTS